MDMFSYFVGILEGEGYIGLNAKKKNSKTGEVTYYSPGLTIAMCDEDVIQKIADYLNVSYRTYKPKGKDIYKEVYRIDIAGRKAYYIMEKVAPYLSKRRQEKFKAIQEGYTPKTTYKDNGSGYVPKPKKPIDLPFWTITIIIYTKKS